MLRRTVANAGPSSAAKIPPATATADIHQAAGLRTTWGIPSTVVVHRTAPAASAGSRASPPSATNVAKAGHARLRTAYPVMVIAPTTNSSPYQPARNGSVLRPAAA